MSTKELLEKSKEVLTEDQYTEVFFSLYNKFKEDFFEVYRASLTSYGQLEAMSAGLSDREIDWKKLHEIGIRNARNVVLGYPETWYTAFEEYLTSQSKSLS